jgi:hypothetical protein
MGAELWSDKKTQRLLGLEVTWKPRDMNSKDVKHHRKTQFEQFIFGSLRLPVPQSTIFYGAKSI